MLLTVDTARSRKLTGYLRWTPFVVALVLNFCHGHPEVGSTADRRLDDPNMDIDKTVGDETLFPSVNSTPWDAGCPRDTNDTSYSVIIHAANTHISNFFRDNARMCTYSRGVTAVQITDTLKDERSTWTTDSQPFGVGHPSGVSNRVRIYHTPHPNHRGTSAEEMAQLQAACEDPSEVTLIIITDEYCSKTPIVDYLPSECWPHVARHYPYSPPSSEMETRMAYIPLGPRDSFDFVSASGRGLEASQRPVFFNAVMKTWTAPRRAKLMAVARSFESKHGATQAIISSKDLESEEYRSMLLDSALTICPGGHNPETFRMFEALESGSIPIISRQDYLYPSYKAPFPCGEGNVSWNTVAASPFAEEISVGTWDELPELLMRLKDAPPGYLDKLQADSVAWYEALMRRTYLSLLNFGRGYDLWPQLGPIVLDGFPKRSEPYPETPPYGPDET